MLQTSSWWCGLAMLAFATGALGAPARRSYEVEFVARFDPPAGVAHVSIEIDRINARVMGVAMTMPAARYRNVATTDGTIARDGDRVTWAVPKEGGTLRYDVVIDHKRANGAYDARMTKDWVIVRGDVLFPPARVRATKGADASARLALELPRGWTDRESGYRLAGDGRFIVVNPEQRFDRPVGWIAAGNLTTSKESIAGVDYRVSSPKGEGLNRIQVLAMLRAATPEARRAFGHLPEKLLIVGAGDPMWRGGLTGPRSIWLHADRKLQSENGTSALLHELVHAVTGIHAVQGDDWIVEGIAEYYSIELARRSGLLSDALAERAIRIERRRGDEVATLEAPSSSGRRTAKAVALLAELDEEIRVASGDERNLDEVVRELMKVDRVSAAALKASAQAAIGKPSKVLAAI